MEVTYANTNYEDFRVLMKTEDASTLNAIQGMTIEI